MLRFHSSTAVLLLAVAAGAFVAVPIAEAQKTGGTLRVYQRENPPSASINEEATISTAFPFSGVFNNLVKFDTQKPVEGLDTIVPELAKSWSLDDTKTKLTFKLEEGVTWHDGKPFTAKDVVCTWDLINGVTEGARKSPRKIWYDNLEKVTADSDTQATFHLKNPQPSFLNLLASGLTPIYPCHVSAKDMRTAPIGTGPFKLTDQAERSHPARAKSELLEEGFSLSRRHRFQNHPQPVHPGAGLHRGRV
jgi:peptide/nickel transport system substrate-binding protein